NRHSLFGRPYTRRLLVLLLIGALHQSLFWWGDILVAYSLGGFLLIPFRKRKNKTILIWAFSIMALPIAGVSGYTLYKTFRPDSPAKIEENRKESVQERKKSVEDMWRTVQVYQTGSYARIYEERTGELLREARVLPFVVVMTLPLFLFGLWVWRQGFVHAPEAYRAVFKKGLIVGAAIGIPANIAYAWGSYLVMAGPVTGGPPTPFMIVGFVLLLFGRPLLSMSYVCALSLLFLTETWQRRLMPFAAIGRTALSNYLLQTIVCTTIFYGYGGAMFAKINLAVLLVWSVVVYAFEVPLSNWWLSRYRFGPAEWAWRSLTYGQAQPMK
ncbi:MAG: DUF418 domain-containing protein, partial [Acidobacteria bacterium]|nr:DUF418 domain-containing protein [Acidobacteriota bacterium]